MGTGRDGTGAGKPFGAEPERGRTRPARGCERQGPNEGPGAGKPCLGWSLNGEGWERTRCEKTLFRVETEWGRIGTEPVRESPSGQSLKGDGPDLLGVARAGA